MKNRLLRDTYFSSYYFFQLCSGFPLVHVFNCIFISSPSPRPTTTTKAIMYEYTEWRRPNDSDAMLTAIDKMVGDYQFTCPTLEMAQR